MIMLGSKDVAMQLARTVSQLRSEPDGSGARLVLEQRRCSRSFGTPIRPELYRLNDAANELMRMLPVTHSTRNGGHCCVGLTMLFSGLGPWFPAFVFHLSWKDLEDSAMFCIRS